MKYVCINENCDLFGKEEYFSSEVYKYRNGQMVGEHCQCPHCGKERKEINPNTEIPLSEKGIGVNLFNGMSKEQRQEMLKKRSHEHFEKSVKERKDGLLNQAITEMRNMHKKN